MDLTTRRGEIEGTGVPHDSVLSVNGLEQCRELVNGTETCDVTGVTGEMPSTRKTNSFSIRNLMGGEDSERSADGTANSSDGKNVLILK